MLMKLIPMFLKKKKIIQLKKKSIVMTQKIDLIILGGGNGKRQKRVYDE